MKTCKKCGLDKPIDDFTVDTRYKDGRYPWCAECRRAWRKARRPRQNELQREWRKRDPEHAREYAREYYQNNEPARTRNREAGRAREKERWQNDPAYRERKNRNKMRIYYGNPTHRARHLMTAKVNVHKRRAIVRGLGAHFTPQEWRDLCAHYGNRCLRCGADGPLVPDHVTPLSRGGSNTIDNIQPLCSDCNARKHAHTVDYRPGSGGSK